jgi:UDP-2,3-diacylglucosamine pyrophosphatase LpxH
MAPPSRRSVRSAPSGRLRALWISDVHLGFSGSQAARLVRFLANHECQKLYLVGDIIDGWKMKTHHFWSPDHTRVIQKVLAKARRGTEVFYIAGNHDSFLRPFLRGEHDFGRVHLADQVVHTTADGRKLLVLHGDRFDDAMRLRWLAQAGDVGYEALLWASGRINRLRRGMGRPELLLSAAAKSRVKSAVQYLSGFDERVLHLCRTQGYRGVVCGHTHYAEIRYLRDGITSYNCGDWVESCTALAEDESGDIQILRAPPLLPARRLTAGPRSQVQSTQSAQA